MLPHMVTDEYSYAQEKLGLAVYSLVSVSRIRTRLFNAFRVLAALKARDLPEHLRHDYLAFWRALTWLPPEKATRGAILTTLNTMSDREVDALAKKIFEFYVRLSE
jgi:hypothetical protein